MTLRASPFEASLRETQNGNLVIIELSGDIDALATQDLNSACAEAVSRGPSRLLLNFSRTEYINSIGIALIVGVLSNARQQGIEVLATGLSEHYREIFEITSLSDFMTIVDDEATIYPPDAPPTR